MKQSATSKPPKLVDAIAGPKGAGETTFAARFLPDFVDCRQFKNADPIAAALSRFAPETQNLKARRPLLERIDEVAAAHEDFGCPSAITICSTR